MEAPITNGESQLELPLDVPVFPPTFENAALTDLDIQDFRFLDRVRKVGWWIPTVDEFAEQLRGGTYDVWRIIVPNGRGILLTSYEIFPSGEKWLSLNYFCGYGMKANARAVRGAFWDLANRLDCTNIIYHTKSLGLVRCLGGKQLSVLYELERMD